MSTEKASTLDVDIAFRIADKNYRIVTVQERTAKNNYDLMIFIKSAQYYRDFGTDNNGGKIKHQKYSVHLSPNSTDGINVIKHILELDDGKRYETRNHTKALKKTNVFAMLFTARSPSLNVDYRLCKNERDILVLDSYNPEKCTLYYSIAVSNADKVIDEKALAGLSHKVIRTNNFSIIIIWQYCAGPSDNTGSKAHSLTIPNEHMPNSAINESDIGYDIEELVDLFKDRCHHLLEEYFNIKKEILSQFPNLENIIKTLGFSMRCK